MPVFEPQHSSPPHCITLIYSLSCISCPLTFRAANPHWVTLCLNRLVFVKSLEYCHSHSYVLYKYLLNKEDWSTNIYRVAQLGQAHVSGAVGMTGTNSESLLRDSQCEWGMVAYTEAGGLWVQGLLRRSGEFETSPRLQSRTVVKVGVVGNTTYRLPDRKQE